MVKTVYSGTNCTVIIANNIVLKRVNVDFDSIETACYFLHLVQVHYKQLAPYIGLPKQVWKIKKAINGVFSIYVKETYCGYNIFHSTYLKNYYSVINLIRTSKAFLYNLPKGIYIDAHPGNFTVLNGQLFFIDLVPPTVNLLPNNQQIIKAFSIFQHTTKSQLERRMWRYSTPDGRISKYNYYLLANKEKLVPCI